MRKRICIISFSPISRDARVLRQIEYLSPHYDLTVIGYGSPHPDWPDAQWKMVEVRSNLATRVTGLLLLAIGRAVPPAYHLWYWQKLHHRKAVEYAVGSRADAYHANDWHALPIAAQAASQHGARLVLDAHEYAPSEFEDRWHWRLLYRPMITRVLRRHTAKLDAAMTVAPAIADRYKKEFGLESLPVLNAPKLVPLPPKDLDPTDIRLVHHGGASPDRRLELMIETLALADRRFSLHFILVDDSSAYVRSLKELAARLAPDRIKFHDPVPPAEIVHRIAEYDIGFYMLKPSNYNNRVALPNKFFDFLAAGLAVCVGPSPGMAALVRQYGFGRVTPSFSPVAAAEMLNQMRAEEIVAMQQAARQAAQQLNADKEMSKVVDLYGKLLNNG